MNNQIFNILNHRRQEDIRWALIGIIFVFVVIPYGIYTNVKYYALLVVAYSFLMTVLKKPGAPLVIISMGLCVPFYVLNKIDNDWLFIIIANKKQWVYIACRLSVFFNALYYLVKNKSLHPYKGIYIISILYCLVMMVYEPMQSSILNIVNKLLYVHLFFAWCYFENISFNSIFKLFTLVFGFISFYAIVQFFFNIVPYQEWYDIFYPVETQRHAAGLCGNALLYSAIILCYHALILVHMIRGGRLPFLLWIFSLFTVIITIERTSLIVFFIELLGYFWFNRGKGKNIIIIGSLCVLVIVLFFTPLIDFAPLQMLFDRFDQGSDHRFAAYPTVLNILSENPLGVGPIAIDQALHWYGTFGLIDDFGTLDNFYLTQMAYYGIFSIIPFLFYFFYLFKAFSQRQQTPIMFKSVCVIFLSWCLIGLSFNIDSYGQLSLLYFGLIGYIFSLRRTELMENI